MAMSASWFFVVFTFSQNNVSDLEPVQSHFAESQIAEFHFAE